jgi:hypothetical protein
MSRAAPPRGAEDKRARAGGTDAIACSEGSDGTPCVPTDFKVDECEPRHADRGSSRGREDRGGGKGAQQSDHPVHRGRRDGIDITPVMRAVVDAAVRKAYGSSRLIHWLEIYAGAKATRVYGRDVWLPRGPSGPHATTARRSRVR